MAEDLADRGAQLKKRFNEQFCMPDRGYYAVALDGRKRQVDACASNMGHCLVYGLIDEDKAPQVVERLMSPEMFSGWGVRTVASDMGAYNPASYHNGSVWPHDNALIASGLLSMGLSSRPWAATTPIRLVTNLMRYDTHVSLGGLWVDPVLPKSYGDLHITNAPMAGGRITIDIADSVPSIQGLPEGMEQRQGLRPYLTELIEQARLHRKAQGNHARKR